MGPRRTSPSPVPDPVISKEYPLPSNGQKQSASKSSANDVVSVDPVTNPICLVCKKRYLLNPVEATMMPCKHFFHSDCVVWWVRKNNCCPVCGIKINTLPEENDCDDDCDRGARALVDLRYDTFYDDDCEVTVKAIAVGIGLVASLQLLSYSYASGFFNFF